ncbi:hypothetical protein IWW34DRAFT_752291 [Fusarium oxysporum f. sp. albedinis]|nr:hypothetical protein IWW34DRAFT_752291 [Fusarium oxysporum f. sp. albedinis]KAJ0129257.1 Uncharacterized protein HZ326_27647 [Fusarium oxysporum f. sp. albedinis]KAK2468288.1 hypothetical protein H9L39_19934 [Fusarium oxysporum f. sp. albedinis]
MARFQDHLSSAFRRNSQKSSAITVESISQSSHIALSSDSEQGLQLLVSGEVTVEVHEQRVYMARLDADLKLHIEYKRPFKAHCNACRNWNHQLASCQLLTQPTTLAYGKHTFPFSALIEGDHPASMETSLISVKYGLATETQFARHGAASLETAKNEHAIIVKPSPPDPRSSQRTVTTVDPITIITHHEPVIDAENSNRFSFELEGLNGSNGAIGDLQSWKLDEIKWHIVQTTKTTQPACEKHRLASLSDMGRVMRIRDTQVLAKCGIKDDWALDGTAGNSKANMGFDYTIKNRQPQKDRPGFACDNKWAGGFEISHRLHVWFCLSLERSQSAKKGFTERVMRVSYDVILTDPTSKDLDWGPHVPPTYEEVGGSPPDYHDDEP